ncbi:MAG: DUF3298 and DUF4163 domain-containing protein [Lachnospiraceae bacterium]|nr:DUF3298 and DUF4163 domain-containing protein [Lachnospiraceae bacterium]
MRRKLAIILAMSLLIGAVGCEKKDAGDASNVGNGTEVAESTEDAKDEGAEKTSGEETTEETTEEANKETLQDKVTITYEGKNDDRYNENGDLILYVYYVHPVVAIADNKEASEAILAEFENDEADFYINCESMESEAALVFEDGLMEDMPSYANEVRFTEKRVDDKVVSFVKSNYSNTGGAHGNNYSSGWNFDVETGKRLTIADIAEDEETFMAQVKEYVLELCETDAYKNRLFPEYKDSIDFVLQDDLWYFDYEGITFISNPYELSAYAEGTLYFTVPYNMLEGLKPEYSYDGGFQMSVSLGDSISIDLNGDDKADEVTFNVDEASDYTYIPKLTINGADYSSVFDENQCYFASPYDEYVIMDIDGGDDYIEIAVQDYGMSDDPMTAFLRYNGNEVIYMGYVCDRVSDMYVVNDGEGKLHARERMAVFETVNMKTTYEIENDKLVQCMQDLYPIAYTDMSAEKGLLQDLYVFTEMSTDSEVVKLDAYTDVIALATDNTEWVQIQYCEDGEIYYVHVVNHYLIDMNGFEVDSRDVFTDIIQAG